MINEVYWIILAASETILFLLFIITIHQLCITNHFRDISRLKRVLLISFNLIFFLILNALVYLSAISPHTVLFLSVTIHSLYVLFEGLTAIISFHTFRLLISFIIDTIYTSTNIRAPKWFTYFIDVLEVLFVIAVIICHSAAILYNNVIWIYMFYIYLGSTILILDIFVIIIFQKPLRLYNQIQNHVRSDPRLDSRLDSRSRTHSRSRLFSQSVSGSRKEHSHTQSRTNSISKIQSAKKLLQGALFVAFIIIIACMIDITFTVEKIVDFWDWSFNFLLISNIMHSVFLTVLSVALILWIYVPENCCVIPKNSVLETWCTAWHDLCGRASDAQYNMITDDEQNKNKSIDSTIKAITYNETITAIPSSVRSVNDK